jgi:epoxyqueuosine reductase
MHKFNTWALENGYRTAWFKGTDIDSAVRRVRDFEPAIDPAIYKRYFESFKTAGELGLSPGELGLIIYLPKKVRTVSFKKGGKVLEAAIPPPIYCDEPSDIDGFDAEVNEKLGGLAKPIRFPMKSMSVLLGVSRYGRNNITYIDGFGSLFIMRSYAVKGLSEGEVELATPMSGFEEKDVLCPECDGCFACIASCPTSAISDNRFLVHAERCLTYFNKNEGPFPAWVDKGVHNCLLGCLHCQSCCPMDEGRLIFESSGICFEEDETKHILGLTMGGEHPGIEGRIEDKYAKLGIGYMREHIGRNLSALMGSGNLK